MTTAQAIASAAIAATPGEIRKRGRIAGLRLVGGRGGLGYQEPPPPPPEKPPPPPPEKPPPPPLLLDSGATCDAKPELNAVPLNELFTNEPVNM
jgi:hypothetical protein